MFEKMNRDAFILGFRDGLNGILPTIPDEMYEEEELESTKANVTSDPEWIWRLIGWGIGNAFARNETAMLDGE